MIITQIGNFFRSIAESIWMVLLVISCVYFNAYSFGAFDPDKLALMRGLGCLLLVACGIVYSERMGKQWQRGALLRSFNPAFWLGVAFFFWMGISSFWSLAPAQSFWGNYGRRQGADTQVFYLVFIFSIVALTHAWTQIERLVDAVLIGGIPMALYAIVQGLDFDPLWTRQYWSSDRPISTQSLPTAVAAVVALLIPFLLFRICVCLKNLNQPKSLLLDAAENSPIGTAIGTASDSHKKRLLPVQEGSFWVQCLRVMIVVFGVVGLSIAWSQSFWLGAVLSGVWLVCVAGVSKNPEPWRERLRLGGYCILLSIYIVAMVVTNSRGPMLALAVALILMLLTFCARQRWRMALIGGVLFGLGCVAFVVALNVSEASWVKDCKKWGPLARLGDLLEESGQYRLRMVSTTWAVACSSNWTLWFGHGLETTRESLLPHLPANLVDGLRLPDRVHQDLLDLLLHVGLVGVTLYVAFITSVVGIALRGLGLIVSRLGWIVYIGCVLVGLSGAVALALSKDASYTAVAVNAGLGLGVAVYLVGAGFTKFGVAEQQNKAWDTHQVLVIAALCGVMCHWVETAFLFPTAATRLLFCLCVGIILVAVAEPKLSEDEESEALPPEPSVPSDLAVSRKKKEASSQSDSLEATSNKGGITSSAFWRVFWPAVFSMTLFANAIFAPTAFRHSDFVPRNVLMFGIVFGCVSVLSIATVGGAWGWKELLIRVGLLGSCSAVILGLLVVFSGPAEPTKIFVEMRWSVVAFFILGGVVISAGMFCGRQTGEVRYRPFSARTLWPAYLIPLVVFYCVAAMYGQKIMADMYLKESACLGGESEYGDQALLWKKEAVRLDPASEACWHGLAHVLALKAGSMPESKLRKECFEQAEQALDRAWKLNPYSIQTVEKQVHLYWIERLLCTKSEDMLAALSESATWAIRGLELAPTVYEVRGFYLEVLTKAGHASLESKNFMQAEKFYRHLLRLNGPTPQTHYFLGTTLYNLKRFDEAEVYLLKARQKDTKDWQIIVNLCALYCEWKKIPQAVEAARAALLIVPPEQRPSLEAYIAEHAPSIPPPVPPIKP